MKPFALPGLGTLSFCLVLAGLPAASHTAQTDPSLAMDSEPPVEKAQKLAPGIISTDDHQELNAVFAPNGQEFYFCRLVDGTYRLFRMNKTISGGWTAPERVALKAMDGYEIVDPWITPDGKQMFYISNAPAPGFADKSVNIWSMPRDGDGWGVPHVLPKPINTDSNEIYPLPVKSGALYFNSSRNLTGNDRDFYVAAPLGDGRYAPPKKLGPPISTPHREGDIFVAPDESYMIFTSSRPGGLGRTDMYISYRSRNGQWGDAQNLGPKVNSADHDYTPVVSPDGRYFFFTRGGDVYWISAKAIGIGTED